MNQQEIPESIANWARAFMCQFCKSSNTRVERDLMSGKKFFVCSCGGVEAWRSEKDRAIEVMEFIEKYVNPHGIIGGSDCFLFGSI